MRTANPVKLARRASRFEIAALIVVGAGLGGIVSSCALNADPSASRAASGASVSAVALASQPAPSPNAAGADPWLIELARRDPRGLLRLARERCDRETGDFNCVFLKQERINGALKQPEEIEVRYRADPLSVYMIWRRGADQARRALFIDCQEFRQAGQRLARVEPAGMLARLIVPDLMVPIHDARARAASRRAIDEFGFRSTLEILERVNDVAAARDDLDFRYEGEGAIDGRATVILVRRLPYTGAGGPYPDAKLILHLDQEWLLPTGVYSYSDRDGRELLGSYLFTQVTRNARYDEDRFRF